MEDTWLRPQSFTPLPSPLPSLPTNALWKGDEKGLKLSSDHNASLLLSKARDCTYKGPLGAKTTELSVNGNGDVLARNPLVWEALSQNGYGRGAQKGA